MPNRASLAICAAVLAASPVAAGAQPVPPSVATRPSNGDVRGGHDNQPSRGEVATRERADGVAPPPAQQQADTGMVERMYQKEMRVEHQELGTPLPPDVKPAR